MSARSQGGTTTVEFAIVGALFLMVMFAVIEFGRTLFTFSVLNEGARRGARVAAVCPVNDAAIAQAVLLGAVPGLTTSNVAVEYLNAGGNALATPAASFSQIRYVRVRIVGYQLKIFIPFVSSFITPPQFSTTLPRESLGIPRQGVVTSCVGG